MKTPLTINALICRSFVLHALLFTLLPECAIAEATHVYHEQTTNDITGGKPSTCGGSVPYVANLNPTLTEDYTFQFKVEYQGETDRRKVYYTTDGTDPSGSFGLASGTTQVMDGSLLCIVPVPANPALEVYTATIPAQPGGTTVKYIIGAYQHASGSEVFANSGSCFGCGGVCRTSICATVFQYTVSAASLALACAPDKTAECGSAWDFDPPIIQGGCGNQLLEILSTTTNSPGLCGNGFAATRVWQATDDCGAVTNCSQTVAVADTTAPSVQVSSPAGGEVIAAGTQIKIKFSADDNDRIASFDIKYSTNGGITFPFPITTITGPATEFVWNVPDLLDTTNAQIEVAAADPSGNTASAVSGLFTVVQLVPQILNDNVSLIINHTSFDALAPPPGFIGLYSINALLTNTSEQFYGPVYFRISELSKLGPDQNPSQPDLLWSADNQAGEIGDTQSVAVPFLMAGETTPVNFVIGIGSEQPFRLSLDLYGAPVLPQPSIGPALGGIFGCDWLDRQPPTLTCQDIVTAADRGACSTLVSFKPDAGDLCSVASLVCAPASGSAFPVGITVVTCTAADPAGNTSDCTFRVTVVEPDPVLAIEQQNGQIVLSWPTTCAGYLVEQTADLSGAAQWSSAAGDLSMVDGRTRLAVPNSKAALFYRLRSM